MIKVNQAIKMIIGALETTLHLPTVPFLNGIVEIESYRKATKSYDLLETIMVKRLKSNDVFQ